MEMIFIFNSDLNIHHLQEQLVMQKEKELFFFSLNISHKIDFKGALNPSSTRDTYQY